MHRLLRHGTMGTIRAPSQHHHSTIRACRGTISAPSQHHQAPSGHHQAHHRVTIRRHYQSTVRGTIQAPSGAVGAIRHHQAPSGTIRAPSGDHHSAVTAPSGTVRHPHQSTIRAPSRGHHQGTIRSCGTIRGAPAGQHQSTIGAPSGTTEPRRHRGHHHSSAQTRHPESSGTIRRHRAHIRRHRRHHQRRIKTSGTIGAPSRGTISRAIRAPSEGPLQRRPQHQQGTI
jgi:hypothetical protein